MAPSTTATRSLLPPLPPLGYSLFVSLVAVPFLYKFFSANLEVAARLERLLREQQSGPRARLANSLHSDTWLHRYTSLPHGHAMDLSDPQWAGFRAGLPILTLAFGGFVACNAVLRRAFGANSPALDVFGTLVSMGFMAYVHGNDFLIPVTLCLINFLITYVTRSRAASWTWCLLALAAIKLCDTDWMVQEHPHTLGELKRVLMPPTRSRGMIPWNQIFNLTILRMISYSQDVSRASETEETKNHHLLLPDLMSYLHYCFYLPLYLTGPIMSYDDFRRPLEAILPPSRLDLFLFLARLLFSLGTFELFNTWMKTSALLKLDRSAAALVTRSEFSTSTYWSFACLFAIWYKFLVIWRFARFFAVLDGRALCPENMKRCLVNNFSVVGFWRDWHASYNTWIVRYLYVPMGGSRRGLAVRSLATLVCFLFVGVWHDLEARMMVWSLLLSAVIVPEIVLTDWVNRKVYAHTWRGKAVRALVGGASIVVLQALNVIGYTVGHERFLEMARRFTNKDFAFVAEWYAWMSLGAFFMMEMRMLQAHAAHRPPPPSTERATTATNKSKDE